MTILSNKQIRQQILTIKALFFLGYAGFAAFMTFFYIYLEETNGFTGTQVGVIAGLQQMNTIIAPPFWGMLADRFGRKQIYLVVLLAIVVLFFGFYISQSFLFYVGFIFLFTFFFNPINALLDNLALDTLSLSPDTSFGELRLWGSIGWSVSTVLTSKVITNDNLGYIFVIASGILMVTWLLSVFCYHEVKSDRKPVRFSKNTVATLFKLDVRLNVMLIVLLVYGIFSAPIHMFVNMYYSAIGASYEQVGYAFAVQAIFELPFFFWGKQIMRRVGVENTLLLTMLITAVRMFCYGLIPDPWVAIIVGASHGIGFGLFFFALVEYLHKYVPKSLQATGHSLIYAFYFGAGIGLGNLFTGYLKDWIGMEDTMLVQASLIIILLLIVQFFRMLPRNKAVN